MNPFRNCINTVLNMKMLKTMQKENEANEKAPSEDPKQDLGEEELRMDNDEKRKRGKRGERNRHYLQEN